MRSFKLSPAEISELHLAHKAAKKLSNTKNAYKINAVLLLGTGWTLEEVSNALLLDEETVRTYSHLYREDGIDTLLKTNHQGRSCKLTEAQQEILNQELQGKIYTTARSVSQFIEKEFSQHYSDSGVTDLLHRLDFVYKKPKLIPNVPDEAVQEQFIKDYYEFMLNKPEDVAVFFMDATHPEHNATAAHGWIKKGSDKCLERQAKGKRVNIHGAINIETLDSAFIETDKVDSQSTIDLFKTLESLFPFASLIYVILDNAGYHGSGEVKEYLKNSRIRMVPLPPQSPNLNLIERLWKFFKKKVVYNKHYEHFMDFKKACLSFFKNMDRYSGEISCLLTEEFEVIRR